MLCLDYILFRYFVWLLFVRTPSFNPDAFECVLDYIWICGLANHLSSVSGPAELVVDYIIGINVYSAFVGHQVISFWP